MVTFAIVTEEDEKIRNWFKSVDRRLHSNSWFTSPFTGAIRSYKHGTVRLYAVDIAPIYPRFVLNVILCLLAVAAVVTGVVLQWTTLALFVYGFALSSAVVINAFWTAELYVLVMRLQLYRLMGRWVRLKRDDQAGLRRLVYG